MKQIEIIFATSDKELQGRVNTFLSKKHTQGYRTSVGGFTVTSRRDSGLQFHCLVEYWK